MNKLNKQLAALLVLVFSMETGFATVPGDNYLVTDGRHELTLTATLKDENENFTEGVLVSFSAIPGEDTAVTTSSPLGISDENGNVTFVFTGGRDAIYADGELEKEFNFNLEYNESVQPISFLLRHANYYDRVEITLSEREGLIIPAVIQVIGGDGPRAATLEILGGERGSIIHADEGGVFNGGLLEELEVPVEGLSVWVSSTQSSVEGSFTFALSGSNFPASIDIPATARTLSTHELLSQAAHGSNVYNHAKMLELIGNNDMLEIYRNSTSAVAGLHLPPLTDAERGVVILAENRTTANFVFYTPEGQYTVRAATPAQKKCVQQAFYWTGSQWLAIWTTRVPFPSDLVDACTGSDIYQ